MIDTYNNMNGPQKTLFKILLILFGIMLLIGLPYLLGSVFQQVFVDKKQWITGGKLWTSGMCIMLVSLLVFAIVGFIRSITD